MKLAIAALLTGSAAAFAPAATKSSGSALNMGDPRSPDGLGVDPGPLDLFDPLGYVDDIESFPRRRAVEIKHGRISMMAFIGMMVQELGITFPALANVPTFGLVQILLFGGIAETVAMPASQYTGGPQDLPGGYDGSPGTIPGGYPDQIEDPEARDRALNVEIQNGRAAMLGVTGCMMHSCLDSCDHHFFYPITHA